MSTLPGDNRCLNGDIKVRESVQGGSGHDIKREDGNAPCDSVSADETSFESVDLEIEELSKLRCQSLATEVVAERYKRRCSDYPGLAFGRSGIYSSNTMMKFGIIKNELHNIMNVQLKRVSIFTLRCKKGV